MLDSYHPRILPLAGDLYTPAKLLDRLIRVYDLKNDWRLAKALSLDPARISKIRSGKLGISADILIRMHDVTGLSLDELRQLAGIDAYGMPVLERDQA